MLIRKVIILIVLSLFSFPAFAQAPLSGLGPATGGKIPHDLSLFATSGKTESFDSLVGKNGMAIFFTRSVGWCPYCQKQAVELNTRAADFESRGVTPVLISYDTPDIQKNFSDKWDFTVLMLSDTEIEAINAFDILNEDGVSKDSPLYGFPHPIIFLVDTDGVIRSKLYIESDTIINGSSYKERPEIDVILSAIDELNSVK